MKTSPIVFPSRVPGALVVSSDTIFFTMQGEGVTAGKPAVFLRLAHCNLDCTWCDTRYAWDPKLPEFRFERSARVVKTVAEEIAEAWQKCTVAHATPRLVITGGEPLLQQASILALLSEDILRGWDIEIETNGTIVPDNALLARVQFNCSPKLAHSGVPFHRRVSPLSLRRFVKGNTYFKFVVQKESDIDEIASDYFPHLDGVARQRIVISPEGVDVATLDQVLHRVSARARDEGFFLGDRLHIRNHGNQRRT